MLTSATPSTTTAAAALSKWRLLVYDGPSRSIISPLFTVPTLHSKGVTLHMLINSHRDPIPDVPAIYFVKPTKENIDIIIEDCKKNLYSSMRLHFTTKLSRPLMEHLATSLVKTNSVSMIEGIFDEFVDFVSLERGVFDLGEKGIYSIYNSPSTDEGVMKSIIDKVCLGLFSVVCTWGKVPIIRCKRGGIAEAIARSLSQLIVENPILNDLKQSREQSREIKTADNYTKRPLLLIMDRNDDLTPLMSHSSTYQALLDDLLPHASNRVVCATKTEGQNDKTSTYDLDADNDPFYRNNKFRSFPEAIESNGEELKLISEKETEVRSKAGGGGVAPSDDANSNALSSAVESLPALLERKKQVSERSNERRGTYEERSEEVLS